MKAVEQTFSQLCDFDFSPLSSAPSSFLFTLLICFDNLAANAWRLVGDRLKSFRNQSGGNAISGSQQFCKRWMYTVYTESHKGSDLPRGSQIITMSHIIVLLMQGHLVGLHFVCIHLFAQPFCAFFKTLYCTLMMLIITSYFGGSEQSVVLVSSKPAAEQTCCGCARWGIVLVFSLLMADWLCVASVDSIQ